MTSINQQVISSISILFNTTLDLSQINLNNLKQVLPIVDFRNQYYLNNLTSLNNTINNYYNNININTAEISDSFISFNTSLNDFDNTKIDNFIFLLNAAYNSGKTTCYNDASSQCTVLKTKSLEFYPKVVNIRTALNNLTSHLQVYKTSIKTLKPLITSTNVKNQLTPLNTIYNNFNFNSAYAMLTAYGVGIKQVGVNLPLQQVSDGIKNGNSSFSNLPFAQFSSQIASSSPILSVASEMDISAIINQFDIATFSSYLNLGSIFTSIINTLGNVKVKTYIWYKDEINYQLNNIYMTDILKWDGYRLLGVIVFISFILLLPLIAMLPTCCYRCPSFLYFEIVCLLFLGLLGCAVLFFVLPFNILLTDTCSNVENYIVGSIDSYTNASLNFEASFYKYNITFNTDLKQLAQSYLVDCKNDQISDLLASIKVIVDDSPNLVSSLILSLGSNVKIRPVLVKTIQDTIYSLMNNLYTSLMQVANLVTCTNLSTKYTNIKALICQDGAYFIATFWFLFSLLTFLILINIAVYTAIYFIFRYFWYDTKIVVKGNILTSADRTVILENEHRTHHHHHHTNVHYGAATKKNVHHVRRIQNVEMRDSTGGIILEDI